ncbi:T9SS type A sorting domain-containing protein [Flavobacterium aciduliphilum]|uniref:Putative secreted protein (Por secretion system target) n=1 Tax=Flavobacterium aciduliphilum TaxID=1101402 RepID=A0A328YHM5_9FLAO|nr:T9SS type A sorting domain-containing protein [Flavobacterium aciduliphilum]RAR70207.1 putative secreted protein (Por secretion system target) [Flavobacterium aciduliphilum]
MIKNYFFALILLVIFDATGQNNYSVSSIPFQQYTATLPVVGTQDDTNSSVIDLPFPFDFYGVTYNQIIVSTNGYIDFRTSLANAMSPWSFNQSVPSTSFPVMNSILGCYHDMFNNNSLGYITYGVYGTAPYRKFIVVYNNNAHFSCSTTFSTFQIILYESQSIIDVQLIDKGVCTTWNSGNAVTGLINATGTIGVTAPGRNTGAWTAFHEGWRFGRPSYYSGTYAFVKCDTNNTGLEQFNLQVVQNDLSPINPSNITLYETLSDAQTQSNPITNLMYTNTSNPQTIYASGNGVVKEVKLSIVDCAVDYDNDTVSTSSEDVNNDTNLANDDTDMDGIPNYLDNDDDGDLVLTNVEYVFSKNATTIVDTDSDGIPNYLDNDDDGDGTLTFKEDYNANGNPSDDDINSNGIPDYLDPTVSSLSTQTNLFENSIALFPNPTSDILNIENSTASDIKDVAIYSISGALVKEVKSVDTIQSISVSELHSGIYFVKLLVNDEVKNSKFIKK